MPETIEESDANAPVASERYFRSAGGVSTGLRRYSPPAGSGGSRGRTCSKWSPWWATQRIHTGRAVSAADVAAVGQGLEEAPGVDAQVDPGSVLELDLEDENASASRTRDAVLGGGRVLTGVSLGQELAKAMAASYRGSTARRDRVRSAGRSVGRRPRTHPRGCRHKAPARSRPGRPRAEAGSRRPGSRRGGP